MSRQYRMTAKTDYANGAIAWPEGMAPFWPKGQERIVSQALYDRVMRDGVAEFEVKFYQPAPPVALDLSDGVQPEEASAAGEALAAYAQQDQTTEPAATPDKRVAALEKARAAKAAKKAAAQADKE